MVEKRDQVLDIIQILIEDAMKDNMNVTERTMARHLPRLEIQSAPKAMRPAMGMDPSLS